ncbi:hypothetical protein, partial [Arthrobacter sp. HMSC06H05]|uniref:hypothetical protein n=1 Tax=Arthrobacter sp. HMSC06H05 TaxID=1581128 RepID=UPI001C407394
TQTMRSKKGNQDASLKSGYSLYHKLSKKTKPGKATRKPSTRKQPYGRYETRNPTKPKPETNLAGR